MTVCCALTRRQLLQLSAAAGSAAVIAPALGRETVAAARATQVAGAPVAQDLELVTVTDTSFVLTWFTADTLQVMPTDPRPIAVDSDAVVRYGTRPDRLDRVAHGRASTAYHYVEITGLRPGTTYYYEALSAGRPASARVMPVLDYSVLQGVDLSQLTLAQMQALVGQLLGLGQFMSASPGSATTLVPPPGRHLATIALTNDLHVGETQSGLIVDGFPPPFSQRPGAPPYPIVMGESMIADIRRRGTDVLIVAGDLTSAALPDELARARTLLDTFGRLRLSGHLGHHEYVVARGNHDQPKIGSAYDSCAAVRDGYRDCVPGAFPLPQGRLTTTEFHGLRLVGLDTTTLNQPGGAIDTEQWRHLEHVLAERRHQPTLVFGHHPVSDESAYTTLAGPSFDLDRTDAARLEQLYARTPGVFLHHSGHTHRNQRTASPVAADVEFLEVAAIKEYPGGYTLLRLYEGGYLANFYKSSSPLACEWSQTSSEEYLGLYPAYTLGSLADRNHVVLRDLRS
ncbi:MAG TPA: metallophosphoesterase family protein [Jatrophihabitantaceae bacterium]|jgi:predicted phosphodiesterase